MRQTTQPTSIEGLSRRMRDIEREITDLQRRAGESAATTPRASGGKPYATVIVAASDSTAADRASADYVCDGAADDATIKEAIGSLDPSYPPAVGGRVLLLEGTYTLADTMTIFEDRVSLLGMGSSTILDATGLSASSAILLTGDNVTLQDFRLKGNTAAGNPSYGVEVGFANYCTLRGLDLIGFETAVYLSGTFGMVVDNQIESPVTTGIEVTSVSGGADWIVTGNHVHDCQGNGIVVDGQRNLIANNAVQDNGGDGILVTGDYNLVTGNICHENGGGGGGYGVQIAALATANRVVGNDLRANNTAPLLDGGSSSVLTYPGHATYGDNFS